MLELTFLSFFFVFFFCILMYTILSTYFLCYQNDASRAANYSDLLERKQFTTSKVSFQFFFPFFRYIQLYLLVFLITFRSFGLTFFFKHVSLESFNFSVYFLIIFFFLFISFFFENFFLNLKHVSPSIDFFIAIFFFFTIAPCCVFANTLLTFFFFLELGSLLTLYLIISSKDFFKPRAASKLSSSAYVTSVFFQF